MTRVMIILGVALACLADDVNRTEGQPNGHFWQAQNVGEKLAFLAGYDAGTTAMRIEYSTALKNAKEPLSGSTNPPNITYGDIVEGLNEFYQHPENRVLPIRVAIMLFFEKVRGASAECLQADAEFWRASPATAEYRVAIANIERLCLPKQPKAR